MPSGIYTEVDCDQIKCEKNKGGFCHSRRIRLYKVDDNASTFLCATRRDPHEPK
jgi:hypothetical protein